MGDETNFDVGLVGRAFNFDQETRIVVNDSPVLDPTNGVSLSAWIKANAWIGNPRIVSKGEYNFCGSESSGTLEFDVPVVGAVYNAMLETTLPSAGSWHHVCATYDGIVQNIYVDGVSLASQQTNGAIAISNPSGVSALNIGAKPSQPTDCCPTGYFDGLIENVCIYNRALSAQEVSNLFEIQSFGLGIVTLPTITISGLTNQLYEIQYVTNLSNTNWITLASNVVITSGTYLYTGTNALGQAARFYRVVVE